MAVSVTMPRLGESVSEGTVTRWLKKEGDRVEADEPLLEVSTDKVDTEIPAPASGTLTKITVQEDETVDVGVELAVIGGDGDSPAEPAGGGGDQAPAEAESPAAPAEESSEPEATQQAPADAPAEQAAAPSPPAEAAEPAAPSASAPAAESAPAAAEKPAPEKTAPEKTAEQPAAEAEQPAGGAGRQAPGEQQPATGTGNMGAGNMGAYVTPLVRKLAAEHDVDLTSVLGTGIGGRIRKQDVLDASRGAVNGRDTSATAAAPTTRGAPPAAVAPAAAASAAAAGASAPASRPAASPAAAQVRGRTEKLSRLRNVIATRMVESLQTSAQLTTVVEADVTEIARLRSRAKADFETREGVKLSFLPFFALAAVEALKAHPKVNSSLDLDAGTVTFHDAEHLGIAVDTERGLLVPVIHNAGDLNLGGLARKIADLAERTRNNDVTPDELGGGTFTLTNTGSRGALFDTPIINQPQVGILGTGTVVKRPVVVDDPDLGEVIAVRSVVYLALTYDHRIVDGADAARFLLTVKERLQTGDFAAELGL
ncbi:MAG TPA: 2-oxoglutarate dehydrogenase, E2 component, dihydrolipoamide succinyltransferase [Mycobacteriales bacterium]|nr:2-oxoglutarate dehydrogenase, E2 component, dihydrolipoamide succinyltransferase [Mycobacteriales bacterium]